MRTAFVLPLAVLLAMVSLSACARRFSDETPPANAKPQALDASIDGLVRGNERERDRPCESVGLERGDLRREVFWIGRE